MNPTDSDNRRRRFFANKMHRDIFLLVLLASLIPAIIVTVCMYLLIFNITAAEVGLPEAIAYSIIPAARKVTIILLATAPAAMLVIMTFAHKISHQIVGPFDRVTRELDECLEGRREVGITVRKTDKLWPLVARINRLLVLVKK